MLQELVRALLTDEHGISEDAYNALYDLCNYMSKARSLTVEERTDAHHLLVILQRAHFEQGRHHTRTSLAVATAELQGARVNPQPR